MSVSKSGRKRLFMGFLIICLLFQTTAITSLAADETSEGTQSEPYTYTITFYAGNQGRFSGTENIHVLGNDKAPVIEMRGDGSAITVTGLQAGAQVTFNNIQSQEANAPVKLLEENGQYHVFGLRKSGYDNDQLTTPSFNVKQDEDYVVAYAIDGKLVSYVIQYQDTDGNTLAPSQTYYGNIGDRPVVAYLYIEGYEPQAYNLMRELRENPADNVFTFIYTPVEGGGTTVEVIDGGTTVAETPGAPAAGGAGAGAGGAGDAGVGGAGAGGEELPDEEVPLAEGPEDLIDLDDEDVPLAFGLKDLDGTTNMLGAVVVSASSIAALLALIVIAARRRKRRVVSVIEDGLDEDK